MSLPARSLIVFARLLVAAAGLAVASGGVARADVLTLSNGDKLKGRLVANADGVIAFKSDILGEITVPADKASVEVEPTEEEKAAIAKAEEEKKKAEAAAAAAKPPPKKEKATTFAAIELRTAARAPAQATKVEDTGWINRVELGLTSQKGRWEKTDFYLRTENNRRTPKIEARFLNRYTYGKTYDDRTADVFSSNFRFRRTLSGKLFVQSNTRYDRNRITLPKTDAEQGAGIGFNIFSNKTMNLAAGTDTALRYRTYYVKADGAPVSEGMSAAMSFFQDLSLAINPRFSLTQDFVAVVNPQDTQDQKFNFNAGLAGRITRQFHITTRVEIEYNKTLAPEHRDVIDKDVDMRYNQRIVTTLSYVF